MSAFQSITPLGTTATFLDWFNSYNTNAVSKLNSIYISRPFAGDGITLGYNSTSGGYTFELSGSVTKNMSFAGDVIFNGTVSLASAQLSGLAFGVSGNYISIGVTSGKVVRVLDTGGLTLAKADTPSGAEVLGVAISVDTNRTIVAVAGKISGSTLANNLISGGFSAGCVYFLDPVVAGGLTRVEPSTLGQVSKPVLIGLSGSEAALLPYRGQYINGISGSSGEVTFNSTLYVTVKSLGESESSFGLRPGYFIASEVGKNSQSGVTYYEGLGDNSYFKATNTVPTEKILGLVSSYVGSYSATAGTNVILKVYPTSSIIPNVVSLNNWSLLSSGIIYLGNDGLPSTTESSPKLIVGNVSNNDLLVNIQAPSQSMTSLSGTVEQSFSSQNIIINGQHHLWQRGRGTTLPHGITTNAAQIKKQYLADRFVMWAPPRTVGFTAQRSDFSNTQTDVLGYPKYYVSMRKVTDTSLNSYYYSVIDDVRTVANKQLTFSVYARTPGGTGTFTIHGIQNISLSPSGNTYINGTTYSTITTGNSNWNRYSVSFIGNAASSGITNSYSLIGIGLVDEGKTFDFAQFMLNEGSTAITPKMVDALDEYARAAPYYQRSYKPDELTGTATNFSHGISIHLMPYPLGQIYKFPVSMKKTPTVEYYSPDGTKDDALLELPAGTLSMKNSGGSPCYNGVRSYNSSVSVLSITPQTDSSIRIIPYTGYCTYDRIYLHYVADADTTIN